MLTGAAAGGKAVASRFLSISRHHMTNMLRAPSQSLTSDFISEVRTPQQHHAPHSTMAKKAIQKDQIVKLIVGAGQASPSPPVGPALGSKGVKSMDFCKVTLSRTCTQAFFSP